MISTRWPAPAKINLFLHIIGRRSDGYHLLQTHFQFLDYGDHLDFSITHDGQITRVNDLADIPVDKDLVVRAARLLQPFAKGNVGVSIFLDKRLPSGGGLGGGSSDAATTLVALNELWEIDLAQDELAEIGLQLGADIPVFIHGQAAWAEGVGEHLIPLDAPEGPVLVVHAGGLVSTSEVFSHPELTRDTPAIKIHDLASVTLVNDCEDVTRRLHPEVGRVLDWLGQYADARMSGTGASIFAAFESISQALSVVERMPEPWAWFVAERRNTSPLVEKLRKIQNLN
ncbi:MAG TPA: 4-(cytidine 5'-diphospho)-2-C-methyl-D-erythritol kinase [Gammaproteobacteria bacterium]|nr:4-(cytidine 5'-diphospho)-2-C-methyl-D-erythritol kinase [Gammaproteobacteria bacterium]|tara:strand:- start:31 stop:885 length:855 start_codon:yes stop_codon:yes gene_type:complete